MTGELLVLISATFLSCKKDKDETEITQEFYLKVTFVVQPDSISFNSVYMLNSETLSSVMGGGFDNIKTLELLETKFVVTYYNGPIGQMISSANMFVSDSAGNGIQTIGTISNQNLASLVNNEQSLAFQQAGAERFIELIKNSPHNAKLTFTGLVTLANLDGSGFVISAIFKFKQHKDNPT